MNILALFLVCSLSFPRLTNNELQTLADEPVKIPAVQAANLKDNDCIIVTFTYKKEKQWIVQELEVWVCGDRLYGPYNEVSDMVLRHCVWRHKK